MKTLRILCLVALVGALTGGCSGDPQVLRDTHFQKGETYFKDGKLAEAEVEYRKALQYDNHMGAAYFRLGEIYDKQENGPGAFQAYVRAADLLPKDVEAHLRAANYLMAGRKFEDARTTALKAVQLDPGNIEALILVGNASAGLNQLERAIQELQAAQKLDAADPRIYNNLGWFEALRGQSEQAESVFRRAVATAPKSAAAHVALANYLSATGRRADGEKSLREAIAVEPTHVPALRALGWFLTMSGRAKEAEPFLVEAAKHDPKPDSGILLADYYVWSGRDADAIRGLEQVKSKGGAVIADTRLAAILYRTDRARAATLVKAVLDAHPQNPDALLLSATLTRDAKKLTEAMAEIEAILKLYPQLAQAHFLRGLVLLDLGQYEEAAKAFDQVVVLNPRAVTARLHQARLQLLSHKAEAARQIANQVLQLAPGNPAARLVVVEARRAAGDWATANREIAELVRAYPDWLPVYLEASKLAIAQSNWTAARSALDRIEALDADSRVAFEGRLAADVGQKEFKKAVERVDARLAKDRRDQRTLLIAGEVYAAAGDSARAESVWKELLSLNPASNEAYDELGRLYVKTGRLDAAEQQFATLADRGKDVEYGMILAGVLAHGQGRRDVAKQRYEKALAVNPESAVAANNLAWIYAEENSNLDVALSLAQKAKRAAPDNPDFIDTLGVVLLKKGLALAAIPEFQAAANKSPKNATIHLHLAQAYVAAKKADDARAAAQKALSIDPAFPEASEARAIVESRGKSTK